jgi:hypothetical protein
MQLEESRGGETGAVVSSVSVNIVKYVASAVAKFYCHFITSWHHLAVFRVEAFNQNRTRTHLSMSI